jgi:hypothetical protein
VHVHEERAAGDNLRLPLAARQQLPLRLLRHSAHSADSNHGRSARKDTADSGYRSRAGLVAKGKPSRSLMRQHTDANRLKLKLTHQADLSDAASSIQQQSRKLRR